MILCMDVVPDILSENVNHKTLIIIQEGVIVWPKIIQEMEKSTGISNT
jgi:hypothetical protein